MTAWPPGVDGAGPGEPGATVLDLGCGGGILLMALAQVHSQMGFAAGVDRQWQTIDQAKRNARLGGHKNMAFFVGDIRTNLTGECFDLVVSNPPFYPKGWGRVSSRQTVAESTHALHGDINDFTKRARRALRPTGQAMFVFDASRLSELLLAIEDAHLHLECLTFLEDDRSQFSRVVALTCVEPRGLKMARNRFEPEEYLCST